MTRMVRHRPISSRGFTLVEVLVAILILSIGLLAMVGMIGVAIQASAFSSKMSLATRSAQEKLEEIKSTPYANVTAGSEAEDADGLTRSWTVADDTPIVNTKTIQATVTWVDRKGNTRTVAFNMVISP